MCCITHLFSTVVTPSRYLHNHHHNLVFSASLTHILFFGQHKKKDASKTQNKSNPIIARLFWPSLLLGRFCCRASHNCVTWERTSGVLPSFSFHAQVKRIFRFFIPPNTFFGRASSSEDRDFGRWVGEPDYLLSSSSLTTNATNVSHGNARRKI